MRNPRGAVRGLSVVAAVVVATLLVSFGSSVTLAAAGTVAAQTPNAASGSDAPAVSAVPLGTSRSAWGQIVKRVSVPGRGCFTSAYPSLVWKSERCITGPNVPETLASTPSGVTPGARHPDGG